MDCLKKILSCIAKLRSNPSAGSQPFAKCIVAEGSTQEVLDQVTAVVDASSAFEIKIPMSDNSPSSLLTALSQDCLLQSIGNRQIH